MNQKKLKMNQNILKIIQMKMKMKKNKMQNVAKSFDFSSYKTKNKINNQG